MSDKHLLVPWMIPDSPYIEPEAASQYAVPLRKLRTAQVKTEMVFRTTIAKNLPTNITKHEDAYISFVAAIAADNANHSPGFTEALQKAKIAANAQGDLHLPKDLFDPRDAAFKAAFKHNRTDKLLHDKLLPHIDFLRGLGVRCQTQGQYHFDDYLEALEAVEVQLNSAVSPDAATVTRPTMDAIATVLQPLIQQNAYVASTFRRRQWAKVSELNLYRTQTNFETEPVYRRARMLDISASSNKALKLS